jgi:hypothetical protein
MKYTLLIITLLITGSLAAQKNDDILFTLEYHYGFNANPKAIDDIAAPFLDEGLGRNFGLDMNFIFSTKKGHLLQFSGSANIINFVVSPTNLIYEFGYDYNDDYGLRLPGFYALTGGLKYAYPFYKRNKLEVLGAAGANLNLDISTTAGWITYENRRLWSHVDGKTGPAIFLSFDLSTRVVYHITNRFSFTTNLTFANSPFYTLDSPYVVNSRDGQFTGTFEQKISSATLGIGLGMKL